MTRLLNAIVLLLILLHQQINGEMIFKGEEYELVNSKDLQNVIVIPVKFGTIYHYRNKKNSDENLYIFESQVRKLGGDSLYRRFRDFYIVDNDYVTQFEMTDSENEDYTREMTGILSKIIDMERKDKIAWTTNTRQEGSALFQIRQSVQRMPSDHSSELLDFSVSATKCSKCARIVNWIWEVYFSKQ